MDYYKQIFKRESFHLFESSENLLMTKQKKPIARCSFN